MNIDRKNNKILENIQKNGKISTNDLAEDVGMPSTTVFERLKKMEKENVITGYKAVLDPEKIGFGFLAFVFIRIEGVNYDDSMVDAIKKIPFVLELHEVAGDYSYLAKVCAKNHGHLSKILKNYFGKIKGITQTNSHVVLHTALDNGCYPIGKE